MIDAPQITKTQVQPAAVIRLTIPRNQIQQAMGPGIAELLATLAALGIAPAGPVFSHHLRLDPAVFDFEIGVPVTGPVAPIGRVRPGQLPAAVVARTIYRGPCQGIGAGWGEFCAWIADNGHTSAADLWESYIAGPQEGPDPARWCAELTRPLVVGGERLKAKGN